MNMKFFPLLLTMLQVIEMKVTFLDSSDGIDGNKCLTCQNTLYYLKIHGKIDCRFTQLPENCLQLSNEFLSNTNSHLLLFAENKISVCDSCFRINYCHLEHCQQQETIIHSSIINSVNSMQKFHYLEAMQNNFVSEEFFINMKLVALNVEKLGIEINRYEHLLNFSYDLTKMYKELVEKVDTNSSSQFKLDNFLFDTQEMKSDLNKVRIILSQINSEKDIQTINNKILDSSNIMKDRSSLDNFQRFIIELDKVLFQVNSISLKMRNIIIKNFEEIKRMKNYLLGNKSKESDSKIKNFSKDKIINLDYSEDINNNKELIKNTKFNRKLKDEKNKKPSMIFKKMINEEPSIVLNNHHNLKIFTNEHGEIRNHKGFSQNSPNNETMSNNSQTLFHNKYKHNIESINNEFYLPNITSSIMQKHDLSSYSEVKNFRGSDLDLLAEKRKQLIGNSAVIKKKDPEILRLNLQEEDSLKQGLRKKNRSCNNLDKLLKRTLKAIKKFKNHELKSNRHNLTKLEEQFNSTVKNISSMILIHNKTIDDYSKNISLSANNTVVELNTTDNKAEKIQIEAVNRLNISIISNLNNNINKTSAIKQDKKIKLSTLTQSTKKDKKALIKNNHQISSKSFTVNKTSIFPLQFLEKSVKSLDDEFYFLTQNLYPDLIFY